MVVFLSTNHCCCHTIRNSSSTSHIEMGSTIQLASFPRANPPPQQRQRAMGDYDFKPGGGLKFKGGGGEKKKWV